ncbi:O-antigen polysaccharide polymerase Wzy [Rhabdothermincola sediminis]|uniref:O-antigen polysaccharide polymerase Wzy n=1 Tax=Rhabdothermincola sediminis TaxID=2751370 RepID=UPI001AA090C7|nr:O-antigen polysaccharide polymerase Wzy [Rhabdothermincola sediminis]
MALATTDADRPIRWVPAAGIILAGAFGALAGAAGAAPATWWLVCLWMAWGIATVFALGSRWPSLALAGLQVFFLLEVLAPATIAVSEGRTMIAAYDVTAGTVGALRLSVLAQVAVLAGVFLARAWRGGGPPVRMDLSLPAWLLDRWAIALLLGAVAGMALYVLTAGGDPRTLVVLVGEAKYGQFAKTAQGPVVKYFSVLLGLAGAAIVVATLRLTSSAARSRWLPWWVMGISAVMLISGGGRWWLGIPAVTAALVWWRTTRGAWTRHPRLIVVLGAMGLFVVAVLVGGLREQAGSKSIDTDAFLAKQLRGGVFATTAVLVDTVPATHPYLGGSSYAELVTMPVPRALWPDKPEGEVKDLQRAFFRQELGASFAYYGEAYANFGWAGAAILCALFGFVLERCWLGLVSASTPARLVAFAAAVPVLLQLFSRGYLAGLVAGVSGYAVGIALVARGLQRWQGRGGLDHRPIRGTAAPVAPGLSTGR